MPTEFYILVGVCIAVMGFSAFYLGHKDSTKRGFARVGLVLGGTSLFVGGMYFFSIFIAVLIVMLPIALVVAWFTGLFE